METKNQMSIKLIKLGGHELNCQCGYFGCHVLCRKKTLIRKNRDQKQSKVLYECELCPNCHNLLATTAVFGGYVTCKKTC